MRSSKPRLLTQLAFAFAVALMFVAPVASAKTTVLKAVIAFNETVTAGSATCPLIGTISGIGQVTHFGKVTLASQDCIVPSSPTTFDFSTLAPNPIVLTFANGDQLFGTYTGQLDFSSGLGIINGAFAVTGGTGQFQNATGDGTLVGAELLNFDSLTGQGLIQLDLKIKN